MDRNSQLKVKQQIKFHRVGRLKAEFTVSVHLPDEMYKKLTIEEANKLHKRVDKALNNFTIAEINKLFDDKMTREIPEFNSVMSVDTRVFTK